MSLAAVARQPAAAPASVTDDLNLVTGRGIAYLRAMQAADGFWPEDLTGTGFPRVLRLRHHGHSELFPLWALPRDRNLKPSDSRAVMATM